MIFKWAIYSLPQKRWQDAIVMVKQLLLILNWVRSGLSYLKLAEDYVRAFGEEGAKYTFLHFLLTGLGSSAAKMPAVHCYFIYRT